MSAPLEIIAGPLEAWLGPVGETMPYVDDTPAGNWVKLGTNGDRNVTEDGISISHAQTMERVRVVGATGPVKALRTEEELLISFILYDLSLEHYKDAMNHVAVADVAAGSGTPGYRHLPLLRGLTVTEKALLLRADKSAYGAGWAMQYEIPLVVHVGEPEVLFKKDEPGGVQFTFLALEDPDAASDTLRFGRIVEQDADAV